MRDRLFVHVVWTTRDRARLVDARVARYLDQHLRVIARQERARVLELGIVSTHVHVLLRLHPTTAIPKLLQRMKGATATLANRHGHVTGRPLRWAKGYHISSVSPRALETARRYVRLQDQHHLAEAIGNTNRAPAAADESGSRERDP
jgi:putative transposase